MSPPPMQAPGRTSQGSLGVGCLSGFLPISCAEITAEAPRGASKSEIFRFLKALLPMRLPPGSPVPRIQASVTNECQTGGCTGPGPAYWVNPDSGSTSSPGAVSLDAIPISSGARRGSRGQQRPSARSRAYVPGDLRDVVVVGVDAQVSEVGSVQFASFADGFDYCFSAGRTVRRLLGAVR